MIAINKILVPVDFSACSRLALEYAIHFGTRLGARAIDVLHVWEPLRHLDPGARLQGREETLGEFVQSQAGQAMKELLEHVEGTLSFEVHGRLESGAPHTSILHVAAEGYDLIVMGTHGRGLMSHLILGSTTERVIRLAPCPVFSMKTMPVEAVL